MPTKSNKTSASVSALPRPTSKWLREVLPPGDPPWVPGTPENVKRQIIHWENGFNAALDVHTEYQTPTARAAPKSD